MRTTLGIALGTGRIAVVASRRAEIRWTAEAEFAVVDDLGAVLSRLLSQAPVRRWPRPRVVVAVGPAASQARKISGLPPIDDLRSLERIVQEGANRFFLQGNKPPVTSGVQPVAPGQVWAAAFESEVVERIVEGCNAAHLHLKAIVPAAVVLRYALEGDHLFWRDGNVLTEVLLKDNRLAAIRRIAGSAAGYDITPVPRPALAKLGEGAWRLADSYGAAVLPKSERLVWRPVRKNRTSRLRVAAAVVIGFLSLLGAILVPGISAMLAERRAIETVAELGPEYIRAIELERDLQRVTDALAEVAAYDASRLSHTLLLADLATVLPEQSAITTIRIDTTASATIVVLTPSVATFLASLEKVPGITSPRLIGPITRERVGERELERATIQLRIDVAVRRRMVGGRGEAAT